MSSIIEQIIDFNNLYWAWEKAKWMYKPGDMWFNELDIAKFEANLSKELQSIRDDIRNGSYQMFPIQPVGYPKSSDETGPRTRQTFWVSVRDQVTWLAVANILGQYLDGKMPYWSYGNRLFISIFKKDNDKDWRYGYYRNTNKYLYRKWTQSWPLFRRHINITTKLMSRGSQVNLKDEIEEKEQEMIDTNDGLFEGHPFKVKYISPSYWDGEPASTLYWASVDLEKFYPKLKIKIVKDNFKKYLTDIAYDKELDNLLTNLFSFRLDVKKWSETDLISIGISKGEKQYDHLPTGLFVSGFLANVAMLNVDNKIADKINTTKAIAHFRFVDDHVFLARSFEELIGWISEYERILNQENIGTTFNINKTEPSAVSEYFRYLNIAEEERADDWDSELKKKKDSAEKESALDPDFPSPLMTQTLAKVSKIAGTDFQLLDPDEEKNLISDVEHLLLVDFPDQELRRDTRVSFAARVLSLIVPEVTQDNSTLYELHKAVDALDLQKNIINSELKKRKKTKELKLKLEEVNKTYQHEFTKFNKEIERIRSEELKLFSRTTKLLLKVIRENPDKIRLWTRIFQFYFNSGNSDGNNIFQEIDKLIENEKLSRLSRAFINSLILQVLANLLFQAYNVLQSTQYPFRKKERAKSFIKGILQDRLFEYFEGTVNGKSYEQASLNLFRFSAGSVIFLLNQKGSVFFSSKNKIKRFGLINWISPRKFTEKTGYSLSVWVWWLSTKISKSDPAASKLWPRIEHRLNILQPIDQVILQKFPDLLSERCLKKISRSFSKLEFRNNEAWLFDLKVLLEEKGLPTQYSFLRGLSSKTKHVEGHISLFEWIKWTNETANKSKLLEHNMVVYDPRLGEWMALEIIKGVASELQSKTENISLELIFDTTNYHEFVHPNNFMLPSDWKQEFETLTWGDLFSLVHNNAAQIKFREPEEQIRDPRFGFPTDISNSTEKNQAILSALASLLICLLDKKYSLPNSWNPIGHQAAWTSMYKQKLRDVPVSSYTRNLIDACFSKRNRETIFFKANSIFNLLGVIHYDDDTFNDPPELQDLGDFIRYVSFCQSKLKKQQITVSSHQPRQLIPISLMQFKKTEYQEYLNNEEEL